MGEKLLSPLVSDGIVRGIKFSTSSFEEICTYSINGCPISHPSQLTNPFLGLPLESGRCEACGTSENGNCEGHFGYIELPVPIYHPSHISELKDVLSLVCFKCMRIKKGKVGKSNVSATSCSFCRDLPPISIKEVKTSDGAMCLQLSISARTRLRDGFWNFLDKFGFHHGDGTSRTLLPVEALNISKAIPEEIKKRLAAKGYFPQIGYIMQYLPVPPNCLLSPEVSDSISVMSTDISISLLKRVLNKIEVIKRSRSGSPNFESHEVECNDLQFAIAEYMHLRGTTKTPHNTTARKFVLGSEAIKNSSKQWVEKMRTLFISKGSGFSSRGVITGDSYIGIDEIGLPSEIAKRVTFEERVTDHNLERLQKMVDNRLCVTYKDGNATFAIAVGSKGHTNLKVGQVINRSIVDGDIVFINRPPSTHKHSLQAFSVFVHDDHAIKINPLVCGPLGADFDGDCIHIFYPQSLAAKAEVKELFSVEQQLLSSHSGQLNFQLVNDSLLSLKVMANISFLRKETAQQLGMFVSPMLPPPAVFRARGSGSLWTVHQILQCALPPFIDCFGQRHVINKSEILKFEFSRDFLQSSLTDIITSVLVVKGPRDALKFLNSLQPLLMEVLSLEGFSVSLKDFDVPNPILREIQNRIQKISSLLPRASVSYNEHLELQIERDLTCLKGPIVAFILQLSSLGFLIDSKSESSVGKVLQQIGFLGLQLFDKGKLYSRALVENIHCHFVGQFSTGEVCPSSEAHGLVKSSLFHGLNPFEAFVHSVSSREVIIRSSRGLTEPGILFKNLMAILRDVVITYDGTIRNVCSNTLIQVKYDLDDGAETVSVSPAGEPVGVLAATAISNPAYKAVLDSSQSTNSSWEQMKEILQSKTNYQNKVTDRQIVLYLNDCRCGKKLCRENAALTVESCLRIVMLKNCAIDFSIEYDKEMIPSDGSGTASGLVGHIHLDMKKLKIWSQNIDGILHKCKEVLSGYKKKKGLSNIFKRIDLSVSECCSSQQSDDGNLSKLPCLQFAYHAGDADETLEQGIHILVYTICPVLLDTIIKGDPRVETVNYIWSAPDAISWVSNPHRSSKGELALEVVVRKDAAKKNGDAWRLVLDACLPVIHLVDTTRSIPYGIQQIKELLGISCAFDQSVLRLSKSIRMVSKGIIKEHLVLVGNSMTCTGNLIGFNPSGFKSLFWSLKVQVPFTEATLFTPMKCFEKAAEKCHRDSLGSTVSSVSWGKRVAVGTGTNFEVLWGQKDQVACNQDVGKDVYDLLAWVREPCERDLTGGCAGSDIDDYQNDDMHLSPEPNGAYEKATFDDYVESDCRDKSDNWQGWESKGKAAADNLDSWCGWESNTKKSADNGNTSKWENVSPRNAKSDNDVWSSWDADKGQSTKSRKEFDGFSSLKNNEAQKHSLCMANKPETEGSPGQSRNAEKSAWEAKKPDSVWKESNGNESSWAGGNTLSWTLKDPVVESQGNDWSWTAKKTEGESGGNNSSWTTQNTRAEEVGNSSRWGKKVENKAWSAKTPDSGWNENRGNQSSWEANKPEAEANESSSRWSKKVENKSWSTKSPDSEWKEIKGNESSWTAKKEEAESLSGWQENSENKTWPSKENKCIESLWPVKKLEVAISSQHNENNGNDSWSAKKPEFDSSPGWKENDDRGNPWVAKTPEVGTSATGNGNSVKHGWKSQGGWGKLNSQGGRGQRNNSPRPPSGRLEDRRGWRRAEAFTNEEEKILVDIEPIMNSIRKAIHESSDGDRLSPEDSKFIIENVFEYHPDKQAKVADKIDYIMVNKHSSFTETRCFYVVSADGSRADFSYIKCMENFVKSSYPDHAESFNRKFFRKRHNAVEPGNNDWQQTPRSVAEPRNSDGQQTSCNVVESGNNDRLQTPKGA